MAADVASNDPHLEMEVEILEICGLFTEERSGRVRAFEVNCGRC